MGYQCVSSDVADIFPVVAMILFVVIRSVVVAIDASHLLMLSRGGEDCVCVYSSIVFFRLSRSVSAVCLSVCLSALRRRCRCRVRRLQCLCMLGEINGLHTVAASYCPVANDGEPSASFFDIFSARLCHFLRLCLSMVLLPSLFLPSSLPPPRLRAHPQSE